MDKSPKNPVFVESGRRGAVKRWGDTPRVVRLDSLPPRVAAAIVALIRAEEEASGK